MSDLEQLKEWLRKWLKKDDVRRIDVWKILTHIAENHRRFSPNLQFNYGGFILSQAGPECTCEEFTGTLKMDFLGGIQKKFADGLCAIAASHLVWQFYESAPKEIKRALLNVDIREHDFLREEIYRLLKEM